MNVIENEVTGSLSELALFGDDYHHGFAGAAGLQGLPPLLLLLQLLVQLAQDLLPLSVLDHVQVLRHLLLLHEDLQLLVEQLRPRQDVRRRLDVHLEPERFHCALGLHIFRERLDRWLLLEEGHLGRFVPLHHDGQQQVGGRLLALPSLGLGRGRLLLRDGVRGGADDVRGLGLGLCLFGDLLGGERLVLLEEDDRALLFFLGLGQVGGVGHELLHDAVLRLGLPLGLRLLAGRGLLVQLDGELRGELVFLLFARLGLVGHCRDWLFLVMRLVDLLRVDGYDLDHVGVLASHLAIF